MICCCILSSHFYSMLKIHHFHKSPFIQLDYFHHLWTCAMLWHYKHRPGWMSLKETKAVYFVFVLAMASFFVFQVHILFGSFVSGRQYQCNRLRGKICLQNDLLYVEWDTLLKLLNSPTLKLHFRYLMLRSFLFHFIFHQFFSFWSYVVN